MSPAVRHVASGSTLVTRAVSSASATIDSVIGALRGGSAAAAA
eukprot:CAMPEP_0174863700 /NCGR_PEP_ID=MMETSP1114-20130205/56775_1 /TAXON_ID=312471 /ORGANISM="Neobodo designis, Strain CCAP 1951/1" /LENGTH=42 /DNA_ID= /DNA_START= /DNA_END= /DNA_ORIENTATION=